MHRRYSIHKDGDLLVEELDEAGHPIDPEPVAPEERLPVHVTLKAPSSEEGRAHLLDLLEMALELESDGNLANEGLAKPEGDS